MRGDLRGGIEALRRPQRKRGLAVVISDFLGDIDWQRSLRAISARHDLLAVEVIDPRDLSLPDVGDVVLHDPETGRTREFTVTPALRADFAAAAQRHREQVEQALRSCGAPVLTLQTDRDWIADVVRFVSTRRHSFGARPGGCHASEYFAFHRTDAGSVSRSVVVARAVGYVLVQRSRHKHMLRFTNMELLEKVAPTAAESVAPCARSR